MYSKQQEFKDLAEEIDSERISLQEWEKKLQTQEEAWVEAQQQHVAQEEAQQQQQQHAKRKKVSNPKKHS